MYEICIRRKVKENPPSKSRPVQDSVHFISIRETRSEGSLVVCLLFFFLMWTSNYSRLEEDTMTFTLDDEGYDGQLVTLYSYPHQFYGV